MDNIFKLAKELNRLYEISYEIYRREVINIIKNKITDKKRIETLLDNILNIPTDKCYELLNILCRYYSYIDEELSLFYLQEWNELYGEEEWKDIKK